MSFRPLRKIQPTAKLTGENAGDLVLTSHCRAVASATARLAAPPPQQHAHSSLASELSGSTAPKDFVAESLSPDPVPTRTSTKRPLAQHDPLIIDNDTDTTDVPEDAQKQKKPKKTPGQVGQHATGLQTDISIIEIDDVDDPRNEWLNKTHPSADIKQFFVAVPRVPGQAKGRMQCKLCA